MTTPIPNPKNALDHLIVFLPASSATNLPSLPSYITSAFTITAGGTHADNLTSNSLIILADGCYIELICFLPYDSGAVEKIKKHWWGPDANRIGWTDWCLTNSLEPSESWEVVRQSYAEPRAGARKRADGVEVKWSVTFPQGEDGGQEGRGKTPFFCHDTTPRDYRVPISPSSTTHPCGAVGVRELTVIVKDSDALIDTCRVYKLLFGTDGIAQGDGVFFEARRVKSVEGVDGGAGIVVRLPRNSEETVKVKEKGFWFGDVVLAAKAGEGKESGRRERIDDVEKGVGGLWIEYV